MTSRPGGATRRGTHAPRRSVLWDKGAGCFKELTHQILGRREAAWYLFPLISSRFQRLNGYALFERARQNQILRIMLSLKTFVTTGLSVYLIALLHLAIGVKDCKSAL